MRKAAFCVVKDRLSRSERRHIAKCLTVRVLPVGLRQPYFRAYVMVWSATCAFVKD